MNTLLIIILIVLASLVYAAYFYKERKLSIFQAQNQIIRERESIASRMLFGYCRKLLLDTESSYINKDEVLGHLVAILNIQGYDPSPVVATQEQTAKDSTVSATATQESSGATCGEDGGGV